MGKQKGNTFEREICVLLSEWWTNGERDDAFWRTASSGGRATTRAKKKKTTSGHYGDICATDSVGEPLIKCLTIETKRGYSRYTFADVLDQPEGSTTQQWSAWFEQTLESFRQAGSVSWLLIQRRDRRDAIVFFPDELFESLCSLGCFTPLPAPFATFLVKVKKEHHKIHCMKLAAFLNSVNPQDIRLLVRHD